MLGNADIVRTLERIADLLEIRGENAFKVRAYRLAAVQVENLSRPLAEIAVDGPLTDIVGFGPAIAEKVGELLRTGRLAYLERLEDEVPPTLIEVRHLPGIGPRTAAMLWREAGISTVDELEAAVSTGRLEGLPRMGSRTLENLARALKARHTTGGARRRPRDEVTPLLERLLAALRALPEAERVEVAGSYRRGRDTVGDLDVLVVTEQPHAVLRAVAALPAVERVLALGESKCSVEIEGLQVDCRAVPALSFGAAWQYFTGSQAHNVRLRGRALRRGLTLNEYGLFRLDGGERVAGATEEEVYAALGLDWMPPQRREDPGEIEAAQRPDAVEAPPGGEDDEGGETVSATRTVAAAGAGGSVPGAPRRTRVGLEE